MTTDTSLFFLALDHYSLSAEIQSSGIPNIRREENGIGTSLGVIIDLFDYSFW